MTATVFLTKVPVHSLLSRRINKKKSFVPSSIDSPLFRHRAVMSLFGEFDANPRQTGKILFRVDFTAGHPPYFLIQSSVEPVHLGELRGAESRTVELFDLEPGQPVVFRVAVNAVRRKREQHDGKMKTIVTPVPYDQEIDAIKQGRTTITPWIQNKLAGALKEVQLVNHQREVLKATERESSRMAIQVDVLDGAALVDDPEALNRLILEGVGREKAYGCGMLSVKAIL